MGKDVSGSQFGRQAEEIAFEYLLKKGYTIRERNWRPKHTHLEVDLICQKNRDIIFVEVKARAEGGIDPAEAVDGKKIRKLVRAANIYLNSLEHDYFYRFDIITITGDATNYELDHLEDAFLPPLTTR